MIEYLGLPYKDLGRDNNGYDCLGLAIAILRDRGVKLHDYAYENPANFKDNSFIYDAENRAGHWVKVDNPGQGDIVVFKIAGFNAHIGIMVDNKRFIHSHKACGVAIEAVNSIRWRNRLNGYYRHKSTV